MSRLDQIRRMSDDDLILFLRRYKSEKSSCNQEAREYIGKYINIIGIEEI